MFITHLLKLTMSSVKPHSITKVHYGRFMLLPLKIVGCWEWYPKPKNYMEIFINNFYLSWVLFILTNLPLSLVVHLYTEWTGIMSNLDKIADGLPLFVSVAIVAYFAIYKKDLYELTEFMNGNFKWHSARGLTNMTMQGSYSTARNFAYFYTACTLFSVAMYVVLPVVGYLWFSSPLPWIYEDVTASIFIGCIFLRQCVAQGFVALAVGQLGVFFACNSILLCGQIDLLCCSLRNVRYTALIQNDITHDALRYQGYSIVKDEQHSYLYNTTSVKDSRYHYDDEVCQRRKKIKFDIYSEKHDVLSSDAIRDCARVCLAVKEYKNRFENFVSPLLALRVVQVTVYLCTLLYAATLKFDMVTVEYLGAVALDIFVYCYFGNQIILQLSVKADRVSTAAYQSAWDCMGIAPRRLLLNMLLANKRPVVMRAGGFLPMNLHTFVLIIKTSFSYYTLLVNVNEKKEGKN